MVKHLIEFQGHGVFSPDGKVDVTPEQAAELNREQDAKELAHWATKPDTFSPAYYTVPDTIKNAQNRIVSWSTRGAYVSTWHGSKLGRITHVHIYRHNFGGRMVSIRVQGTNGATYYGQASRDGGNIIRLRKMK